jgi:hypothetical protein
MQTVELKATMLIIGVFVVMVSSPHQLVPPPQSNIGFVERNKIDIERSSRHTEAAFWRILRILERTC